MASPPNAELALGIIIRNANNHRAHVGPTYYGCLELAHLRMPLPGRFGLEELVRKKKKIVQENDFGRGRKTVFSHVGPTNKIPSYKAFLHFLTKITEKTRFHLYFFNSICTRRVLM